MQPVDFPPGHIRIAYLCQQDVDGIENDPFGAGGLDLSLLHGQHSANVKSPDAFDVQIGPRINEALQVR